MSNLWQKDGFEITWDGLTEFVDELDKMDAKAEMVIDGEMKKFGRHLSGATRKLVHHDEGNLERSISDEVEKEGPQKWVLTLGSSMPYALRRHEEPYRMGTFNKLPGDGFYVDGRGRSTRGKPSFRGFEPGRKFLDNAITALEDDYNRMNSRILERIMGLNK